MKPEELSQLLKLQAPLITNVQRPKNEEEKYFVPFALIPSGMQAQSLKPLLDEWLEKPVRRKGEAKTDDLDSFVRLTRRFQSEASALFARGEISGHNVTAQLLAVLNYYPEGGKSDLTDWKDHTVKYDFPVSKDLQKWLEADGDSYNQKDFALFLEDNACDLVIPDVAQFEEGFFGSLGAPAFATPSDIMHLSRGIDVRVNEKVHSAFRHADGTQIVQFTSEHANADGQPLRIPEWFALGIRVFEGGLSYQIPVRLRYRVHQGSISWSFQIFRMQAIFDTAFDVAIRLAAKELNLPMFKGTPER